MIYREHTQKIVFNKQHGRLQASYSPETGTLDLELRIRDACAIFATTLTQQSFKRHTALTPYFPSLHTLHTFLRTLNDACLAVDGTGRLRLSIFTEELQERTIDIQLQRQSEADLFRRVESLERNQQQQNERKARAGQESQMQVMRGQLARMTTAYSQSVQKLRELNPALSQPQFSILHKHDSIAVEGRRVTNAGSDYEIRWALLGPAVSTSRNTFLQVKAKRVSWLAVGLCHKGRIEGRRYSRLNGCGDHGGYLMDSAGWFYAHEHPSSNYKPIGFPIAEGDLITLIYNPHQATVCLINQQTWQKCEVSLRVPGEELHPCVACSRETDIEVVDYLS